MLTRGFSDYTPRQRPDREDKETRPTNNNQTKIKIIPGIIHSSFYKTILNSVFFSVDELTFIFIYGESPSRGRITPGPPSCGTRCPPKPLPRRPRVLPWHVSLPHSPFRKSRVPPFYVTLCLLPVLRVAFDSPAPGSATPDGRDGPDI